MNVASTVRDVAEAIEESSGGFAVVCVGGEPTATTAAAVHTWLVAALDVSCPRLAIDLSRVTACDGVGTIMLEGAARVAADHGGEVRLAAPAAAVCRMLRRAGTMTVVATYATVEGATRGDVVDMLAAPGPY